MAGATRRVLQLAHSVRGCVEFMSIVDGKLRAITDIPMCDLFYRTNFSAPLDRLPHSVQ